MEYKRGFWSVDENGLIIGPTSKSDRQCSVLGQVSETLLPEEKPYFWFLTQIHPNMAHDFLIEGCRGVYADTYAEACEQALKKCVEFYGNSCGYDGYDDEDLVVQTDRGLLIGATISYLSELISKSYLDAQSAVSAKNLIDRMETLIPDENCHDDETNVIQIQFKAS